MALKDIIKAALKEAIKEESRELLLNVSEDILKKVVKEAFTEHRISSRRRKRNPDFISKNQAILIHGQSLIDNLIDNNLIGIKDRTGTGKTSTIFLSKSEISKYKDLII